MQERRESRKGGGKPADRHQRAAQPARPAARVSGRPGRRQDRRTARRFYRQFPAGLSALVEACLVTDVEAEIESADDSSVTLAATSTLREMSALPYIKNAFQVLGSVPRCSLASALDDLAKGVAQGQLTIPHEGIGRPYRLMAHIDGQLTAMPKPAKTNVERAIGKTTRSQVAARGSCDEYWVIGRRDMDTYFLARRGTHPQSKDKSPAGSLAPELADLLIRMSATDPCDRFLDPFAGSHALAIARSRYPAQSILSSDLGSSAPQPSNAHPRVTVLHEDALLLTSVEDHSVDVIVTDPPWGEHQDVGHFREFLDRMWAAFDRVLALRDPRVEVLMTRSQAGVLLASAEAAGYHLDTAYDLLVNGHPASALLFRRGDLPE